MLIDFGDDDGHRCCCRHHGRGGPAPRPRWPRQNSPEAPRRRGRDRIGRPVRTCDRSWCSIVLASCWTRRICRHSSLLPCIRRTFCRRRMRCVSASLADTYLLRRTLTLVCIIMAVGFCVFVVRAAACYPFPLLGTDQDSFSRMPHQMLCSKFSFVIIAANIFGKLRAPRARYIAFKPPETCTCVCTRTQGSTIARKGSDRAHGASILT